MGGFQYVDCDGCKVLMMESYSETTEIIPKTSTCNGANLSSLPTGIYGASLVQTSEEEILLCGGHGNEQKCLELNKDGWQEHSNLTSMRKSASAVSMPEGIFIFGGWKSKAGGWEWWDDLEKV